MSLLSPASAINHVLKPALIFAAVTAQAAEAAPPDYYVDEETAKAVTYEKNPDHVVQLFGSIDTSMAKEAIQRLHEISKEDTSTEIVMQISSTGGDVYAGFAILDAMNSLPNPITTVCIGLEASMAAIIAIGNKGENLATENCRIMIHEPSSSTSGTASSAEQATNNLGLTRDIFIQIVSDATGLSQDYAKDLVSNGNTFLTAEEAVSLNLLDGIIPSIKTHPAPIRDIKISSTFCDETRENTSICRDWRDAESVSAQTAEQRDFAGPAAPNP